MKKYLITGGLGMLGSNLAKRVIESGHKLCIIDSLFKLDGYNNLKWLQQFGNFEFFNVDIKDLSNLASIFKNFVPDIVFHVAGQVAMTTSIIDPLRDFQTNAVGGFNVMYCIKQYCPNAIAIYSSTNKVYGDLLDIKYIEQNTRFVAENFENGFDENLPINYSTPYGCSKGVADGYFLDWAKIYNLNTVVLRHSTIYGNRQYANFEQGWIGWFCGQAVKSINNKDNTFTIAGTGKQVRDILYISDTVDLYFNLVNNINLVKGKAFNIGGGIQNSFSIIELLTFLEEILEVKLNYTKIQERQSDQKFFVCNFDSLTNLIGWLPKVSKFEGIKQMVNWLKESV
jgi:CDP-paratose 2-epimerase